MASNLVIGAIHRYNPEEISLWVRSLNKSGYDGKKIMIVYDGTPTETLEYLYSEGFEVIQRKLLLPLVVQRFLDYYNVLIRGEYNKVFISDVKDVIFQKNPFDPFDAESEIDADSEMIIGTESIKIDDMPWAKVNYSKTFPLDYEGIKEYSSVCAGVLYGNSLFVRDFCMATFKYSVSSMMLHKCNQPADQAALNVLLRTVYRDSPITITNHSNAWVTHLGVSFEQHHQESLNEEQPVISADGFVVNSKGKIFTIIHQYDRFDELFEIIREKYS